MLNTHIIDNAAEFYALRDTWNETLDRSGSTNPFLRHEWLSAWWKAYGRGKKLRIAHLKSGDTSLGFLPLMLHKIKLLGMTIEVTGFLSSHWTRMDFILTHHRAECVEKIVGLFRQSGQTLLLAQMDNANLNYALLKKELLRADMPFYETLKTHMYVPICATWDAYLKERTYRFRSESKKKLKLLEESGELKLIRSAGRTIDAKTVDTLKTISLNSWQGRQGLSILSGSEGEAFYKDILARWAPDGKADIVLLTINDEAIAYIIGIRSGRQYFVFDTAFTEERKNLSPGLVIHNMLLEELFQEDIHTFDFGYSADYKKRWTGETETMADLLVWGKGPVGMLLKAAYVMKGILKKEK